MNDIGLWSLVPPVVAIALALLTREIVLSLIAAIVSGTAVHAILTGGSFLGVFRQCLDLIGGKMSANMPMVIFLCLLGALVSVLTRAGGARAYGEWAYRRLDSERAANLMTIVMGLIIFIDDYFNCLTVGTVMRPVTDRFKISRAKLAYFIDTTAAPVCILMPVSSWAAYVISCLPEEIRGQGLALYLHAAPYNFYAILSLVLVLVIALRPGHDFGLMKRMERIAHRHRDVGAEVVMREGLEPVPVSDRGHIVDLVAPIVLLIGLSAWLLTRYEAGEALALAAFLSLVAAFLFLVPRRVINFHQFAAAVLFGIKTMVPALVLLALAWGISAVCTDVLGTGGYIASAIVKGGVPLGLLPAALFVFAALFAFTTGASWGAIGILVPIGMSVVAKTDPSMTVLVLAATLSGSVMGDHCSPISDTSILSSAGAQCKHMNHVMTQLPYALVAGAVSIALYLLLGFVRVSAADCGAADLWSGFADPPLASRPWCYHHWVNGNVDKATLTADLEDMRALGFGGVNMIDSRGYWDDSIDHVKVPPVDIVWGSEKWYDMVEHEMRECARLGLAFTMNAACSGGTLSRQIGDKVVETDVTNRDAVRAHLDAAIGPLLKRCPELVGTTFTHLYSVSYEGKKAGGSWKRVKDTFYAAMTEWAHEHGLKVYSESGGPWDWGAKGVKLDCSQIDMLAVNDFPQGEFWPLSSYTGGGEGVRHANANVRLFNRGVVLGARRAGSRIVSAEAFTHMLHHYSVDPSVLKPTADAAFADGVNRLVWHTYGCSPARFGVPGAEYFAGSHVNRHVTWHDDASAFIGYLGRCQYLLQSGEPVDDGEFVDGPRDYWGWGRFRRDEKAPFTTTHRRVGGTDLFFVAGEGRGALALNAPLEGRSVEIWDAVAVTRRPAEVRDGKVLLDLPTGGSCFVVVGGGSCGRRRDDGSAARGNGSARKERRVLNGPWEVSFAYRPGVAAAPPAPMRMASLAEWTTLEALRDFGGTASYRTTFACGEKDAAPTRGMRRATLSLGELPSGTARVFVNGTDCGVAWCFPFEVDVSKAVKSGTNALEIRYSNNWHNRLTADAGLPEGERVTRSMFRYSDRPRTGKGPWECRPTIWSGPAVGDARQKSGLIGPVEIHFGGK